MLALFFSSPDISHPFLYLYTWHPVKPTATLLNNVVSQAFSVAAGLAVFVIVFQCDVFAIGTVRIRPGSSFSLNKTNKQKCIKRQKTM